MGGHNLKATATGNSGKQITRKQKLRITTRLMNSAWLCRYCQPPGQALQKATVCFLQ